MIRAVTVFETPSGKRFAERKAAEEAVADECRKLFEAKLKHLLGPMSRSDLYKVIIALAPDPAGAKALVDQLNAIIGEPEDETDD